MWFSFWFSDMCESSSSVVFTLLCCRCWFLLRDAVTIRSPDPGLFPETPSWSVSPISHFHHSFFLCFSYFFVTLALSARLLLVCMCVSVHIKDMMDVSFMTSPNLVWANLSCYYEDTGGVLWLPAWRDDYLVTVHMKAWLLLLVVNSRITGSRISNHTTCFVHCFLFAHDFITV